MNLIQLRYFQGVCSYGNITKAAKEMHISQPSVTNAIQQLESEFGINLFIRQGKHLILTKEGEFFLEQIGPLLERVDNIEEIMKDLGGKHRSLRIGIPPMIGTFLFPYLFHNFNKLYPDVHLDIKEYGSLTTKQMIQDELIDIAIVLLDEYTENRYNCINILKTQLLFCFSPNCSLANKESISISDIGNMPIILMNEGSIQNYIIKKMFKDAGIEPNVLIYTNQLYTIKEFIHINNAGAFLLDEVIDNDSSLIGKPIKPDIHMNIGLIWKKGRNLYSNATQFIGFTKKFVNNLEKKQL